MSVVIGPVPAETLPTIRVRRPYGGRGSLRQFLRDVLKDAAPAALDSNELAFRAIDQLGLHFSCPEELYRFKNNTIGRALRHLEHEGTAEPAGEQYAGPSVFGAWRWKVGLPSLEELAEQAVSAVSGTEG